MRRLTAAGLSDIGRNRTLNEDSFYFDEEQRLFLVADGMGGHAAGEVASREAINRIAEYLSDSSLVTDPDATEMLSVENDDENTLEDLPNPVIEWVSAAVQHANDSIYGLNQARNYPEGQGMGTTVVGLWMPWSAEEAVIFNVGDSRLYLYREGEMSQLTKDHTWYQYWLDNGQIGPAPATNIVMRALGISPQILSHTRQQTLQDGDLLLLCSDGLTAMLADATIENVLADVPSNSLQWACERLVNLSNEQGGRDNITVILTRYTGP
jgi:PPM family protein phosphatase